MIINAVCLDMVSCSVFLVTLSNLLAAVEVLFVMLFGF